MSDQLKGRLIKRGGGEPEAPPKIPLKDIKAAKRAADSYIRRSDKRMMARVKFTAK